MLCFFGVSKQSNQQFESSARPALTGACGAPGIRDWWWDRGFQATKKQRNFSILSEKNRCWYLLKWKLMASAAIAIFTSTVCFLCTCIFLRSRLSPKHEPKDCVFSLTLTLGMCLSEHWALKHFDPGRPCRRSLWSSSLAGSRLCRQTWPMFPLCYFELAETLSDRETCVATVSLGR